MTTSEDIVMDKPITLHPIGIVHSPYKETTGTPIQGIFDEKHEAWIEPQEKYAKRLERPRWVQPRHPALSLSSVG